MDTAARVLVSYATAAGSTAGIAHRIADVLRSTGCVVRCRSASGDLDLDGVDALVLGSAVHNMAWLPPAVDLLDRAAGLDTRAVWCFSVGGLNPRGRIGRAMVTREARTLEQQFPAGLAMREHRLFGGVVKRADVPLWGRVFYRMVGSRSGDHRDWTAIEAWASSIARQLAAPGVPGSGDVQVADPGRADCPLPSDSRENQAPRSPGGEEIIARTTPPQ
jgi:menaquinone-dependent protoporphyrinogen oxidase